jgi:hypothetical protein
VPVVESDGTTAWYAGTVNGGVWKSSDIGAQQPSWHNVLDNQPVTCSSISALHASSSGIYAGCGGSTSSMNGVDNNVMNSGDWGGVMVSKDSGSSWSMTNFPPNYYVTSILSMDSSSTLLVSALSALHNVSDGGIWRSTKGGPFQRVSSLPTFTLLDPKDQSTSVIVATHAKHRAKTDGAVSYSHDGGASWTSVGESAMDWGMHGNGVPFYTIAAMSGKSVYVGALTVDATDSTKTSSKIYYKTLSKIGDPAAAWKELAQPTAMDEDAMPKDRMALLGDPTKDFLYVAGNAGALAWRVDTTTEKWTKLWDDDVVDGSEPHGDCRNYEWDAENGRLVLVSDGGIFARVSPSKAGGKWVSLNGDIKEMEFLTAHYDSRGDRYVGGAQDNSAQVMPLHSTSDTPAIGFVGGDGTITLVDNSHNPSRLYGTTQFLGVGSIDLDPSSTNDHDKEVHDDDDDDEDCGGLCFVQGDKYIGVPLADYFPTPSSFPFFVQPYALHAQDPSRLVFWVNGTNDSVKSSFYEFVIDANVTQSGDIGAPRHIFDTPPGAVVLNFFAGGHTLGNPDPSLLVAMDASNLYVRDASTGDGEMFTRKLPVEFAAPVTLGYNTSDDDSRILGPVSHGSTTSLAMSPSDSSHLAITGWQSVYDNEASEQIFTSTDTGKTWTDVTGNLREVSGVVGKVRPGGLLMVDLLLNKDRALLVSTANGVFVSFDAAPGKWTRLGTCADFPIVLTKSLSYEHYSDTLVAATFGRGIYSLKHAKQALLLLREAVLGLKPILPEESSAPYFAPQQA